MTQLEKVVSKFKANREAKKRPTKAKVATPQKVVSENLFNPNRETCWVFPAKRHENQKNV